MEFGTPFLFTHVKGRFRHVELKTLEIDEQDFINSRVEVDIDPTSLDTGSVRRDTSLHDADFLDVTNYPVISFRSTNIEPLDDKHFRLHGDLTLRGVTRGVVLEATRNGRGFSPWGGEVAGFSATTTLDRRDFGISWNTQGPNGHPVLSNSLDITIHIQPVRVS